MPEVKPPSPKFRVSLKLGNETQTKVASSIVEALDKFDSSNISKAKAILTVKVNKRKAEVFLYPFQTRKLFVNKVAKELFQKRLIGALK